MVEYDSLRSPIELRQYFHEYLAALNSDVERRKKARLKPGKLVEELYPFSSYVVWRYPEDDVQCKIIDGNQGYDGVVYKDGILIEKVEVCRPIEGQMKYEQAIQLNNQGYTETDVYDMVERQNDIIRLFLNCANKKAEKDYKGCTLLFSLTADTEFWYFDIGNLDGLKGIDRLVAELKKVVYCADRVFLLRDPNKGTEPPIIQIA